MELKPRKRKTKKQKKAETKTTGTLIIIGGGEDKTHDMTILKEVASRSHGSRLVVVTAASTVAEKMWETYNRAFRELGLKDIVHFRCEEPADARKPENLELFKGARSIFFTGGDQLKITTKIGGSPTAFRIEEIFRGGGLIAGTSAGASVMGQTMLVSSEGRESHKVGSCAMQPGLGFISKVLIDQHFAQRGRIGRLLGAVALNPGILGIGIDEDTALVVVGNEMEIIGTNAVYVVDGSSITYSNISEAQAQRTMSLHNAKLHVLASGDVFDLIKHKVIHYL